MGKIIEIPFSKNLVEFVAERLIEREKHDFSSTAVVFPHQRPGLYLRRIMAQKLGHSFFPPRILSMDEFMAFFSAKSAPGRIQVNSLDSAYLFFEAVKKIPGNPWQGAASSFSQFLFWGLKLDRVIEELDLELVKDECLKGISMGEYWEPEVARTAGHLMNHLAQIRQVYHALLEERNLTTRGRSYARAAQTVEEAYPNPFGTLYFTGLFAMTRAEKTVIKYFLGQPEVSLIRQNDGARWTPFEEMDAWAGKEELKDERARAPQVFLYSAFNTHSEVVGLGDVLMGKGADQKSTAVVLPEPGSLIPFLSEVMTSLPVDYNITMGYPVLRTPVYALLDLLVKLQENKRGDAYYVQDYLSLLMHPYIKNIRRRIEATHTRILVHSIEELLLAQGKTFIELAEIEQMSGVFKRAAKLARGEVSIQSFKDALSDIHEIFIRRMSEVETIAQLGSSFEEVLTFLLRHSSAAHYPFSGEFFHSFFLLLDEVKNSLVKDEGFQDPGELFDLFRYVAREKILSFQGIPLKGLQILGLLETRCLNFDRVFLLDANEGILPSIVSEDSLLPLPIRAALELPLHYQNEEIYRYHFQHLISSTREAHIFYRQTEKDIRSRFVERLVWEKEKSARRVGVLEARPVELDVSLGTSARFGVAKTPEVLQILHGMSFSPSALNSYLGCPAQFYFARVLGLKEKGRIPSEMDPALIGVVLHKILERLYQGFAGKGVLGEEEYACIEENLPGVLEGVFAETFGEVRGEYYLLKEMALSRLRRYILSEKGRFLGKASIISTEETLSYILNLEDGIKVRLEGRVDRIDHCVGEYILIDYKSGRDLRKDSFGVFDEVFNSRVQMKKNIKSLQLPFYVLLYQRINSLPHEGINSKLISLRTTKEVSLFGEERDREKVLEDVFLPILKRLIQEILSPKIPFVRDDTDEKTCQYCSFQTFCHKRG